MTRDRCCFCGGKVEGQTFYVCTQCGAAVGFLDLISKKDIPLNEKYKLDKRGRVVVNE